MLTLRDRTAGASRWAPRPSRTASTSPCSAATAPRSRLVLYPLEGDDAARRDRRSTRSRNRTGDHWHVLVAGLPPRLPLRLARRRPARRRPPLRPRPRPARPGLPPPSPAAPSGAGTAASRDPQRGTARRSLFLRRPFDWQRRRAAADAARRLDHLRAARPRLHLPPVVAASRTRAPSPAWSRRSPT